MSKKIEVKKIKSMRAAYFHAFSDAPEEDAWRKAETWAKKRGLLKINSNIRIFGRNTYPTENPEPHGYGYFITIAPNIKIEKEMYVSIIPGGLYVVSQCEGVEHLSKTWGDLWKWVNESEYKYIGETKSEFGYELGFEEFTNWYPVMVEKSEKKLIFNLMLQLREQ